MAPSGGTFYALALLGRLHTPELARKRRLDSYPVIEQSAGIVVPRSWTGASATGQSRCPALAIALASRSRADTLRNRAGSRIPDPAHPHAGVYPVPDTVREVCIVKEPGRRAGACIAPTLARAWLWPDDASTMQRAPCARSARASVEGSKASIETRFECSRDERPRWGRLPWLSPARRKAGSRAFYSPSRTPGCLASWKLESRPQGPRIPRKLHGLHALLHGLMFLRWFFSPRIRVNRTPVPCPCYGCSTLVQGRPIHIVPLRHSPYSEPPGYGGGTEISYTHKPTLYVGDSSNRYLDGPPTHLVPAAIHTTRHSRPLPERTGTLRQAQLQQNTSPLHSSIHARYFRSYAAVRAVAGSHPAPATATLRGELACMLSCVMTRRKLM